MSDEKDKTEVVKAEDDSKLKEVDDKEQLPMRQVIEEMLSVRPSYPPYLEKINEEHITKILESGDQQDQREYNDGQEERRYNWWYLVWSSVVFVVILVFLVYMGKDNLLSEIIAFLIGIGGGYGLARYKASK